MKHSILIIMVFSAVVSVFNTPCSGQIFTTIDPDYALGGIGDAIEGQNVLGTSGLYSAYLYNGSTYTAVNDTDLTSTPTFQYGSGRVSLAGISGNTIVGNYYFIQSDDTLIAQSFIDNNGVYTSFDTPFTGQYSWLLGVSGNTLFGEYTSDGFTFQGYIYENGVFTQLNYVPAGMSGSNIVGNMGGQAYLFSGSNSTLISYPGAYQTIVTGIDGSEIVGYYKATSTSVAEGFILIDGVYTSLVDPIADGFTVINGVSGNMAVGTYLADNGELHAFEVTLGVPEPSTCAVLGIGFLLLLGVQRIRRANLASN